MAWWLCGEIGMRRRTAAAIRAVQEKRLPAIVEHAYRTVPFYGDVMRAQGLEPRDIRTVDDLARLPIIERGEVQADPERFLSRALPKADHLALRSGGSSGAPRVVYHDPRSVLADTIYGERHLAILRSLAGKHAPRVVTIGSPRASDVDVREYVRRHAIVPRLTTVERVRRTFADRPEDVARDLATIRPDVLLSYGSYLESLARVIAAERSFVPRVFAYAGDPMSAAGRRHATDVLGVHVWSAYQAVEAMKIAFECERHALPVHADLCVVRVVDRSGRDVAPGTVGDVLISNLVNRGTVLFNYRLGDEAALVAGTCSCGRALPLMDFPVGRVEDWLEVSSGARIYTQRLRALFTDEEGVWQYQMVQERSSAFRVALVAAAGADRSAIAARVGGALAAVLGPGVAIRVDFVDALERTAAGKVRTIIRAAPDGDQATTPTA